MGANVSMSGSISGHIRKCTVFQQEVVQYHLPIGNQSISLNNHVGKKITLQFSGSIQCINCQQPIKKSYQQGYCFPCTQRLASCDLCIVKPELCHFHLGTCREEEWAKQYCMIPHVVYLANVSHVKVGITRAHQKITRWIDQGAVQALPIFSVMNRRVSGFLEVAIAKHISDRTQWQKMLKEVAPIDLKNIKNELLPALGDAILSIKQQFGENAVQELVEEGSQFSYPVIRYPSKMKALSFDTTEKVEGVLIGIKGQYLMFDQGVLNIRKHAGYEITFLS